MMKVQKRSESNVLTILYKMKKERLTTDGTHLLCEITLETLQ